MRIETLELAKLNPATYNPRKNLKPGDAEYEHLANSIDAFGYIDPIIVNERTGYTVVGGHQRLKILKARGESRMQCVIVDFDELTEKAANVALNKISGEFDIPALTELISELDNAGFDLDLTGFGEDEIHELLGTSPDFKPVSENQQPRLDEKAKVTCPECGHEFSP